MPDDPDRDDRDQDDTCPDCYRPRHRCRCEVDDRQQPNDMTADDWREFYATHPDYDIADDLEP